MFSWGNRNKERQQFFFPERNLLAISFVGKGSGCRTIYKEKYRQEKIQRILFKESSKGKCEVPYARKYKTFL